MFNLLTVLARVRFDVGSPIGVIIISAVVIGLVYGILSFVVEKVILPIMKVPEDKRENHILSKIILWFALFLVVVAILFAVLPAFGINIF
jgi:hypothetical protein